MTDRPHLLYLAHRIPYPPDKGDKIRSWHQFQHLCTQYNVHLGCFIDDSRDLQYREKLRNMAASSRFVRINRGFAKLRSLSGLLTGAPLTLSFYPGQAMTQYVHSVQGRFTVRAQIGFSAAVVPFLAPSMAQIPTLVDFCDSDAAKWSAYAEQKKGVMAALFAREGRRLVDYETKILNKAHHSFAVTQKEAAVFAARAGVERAPIVLENGVDTVFFDPLSDFEPDPDIPATGKLAVFVGAMDYAPNIEAVQWFARTVWPGVRASLPDACFAIVGARPTRDVIRLREGPGVLVTGRVNDVRPWLKRSDLAVAPLEIARGIQNKVLEAMAMARPVLASPGAADGIDGVPGRHLQIEPRSEAMARIVVQRLQGGAENEAMGRAARAFVVANHGWAAKLGVLDQVLDELV